MIEPSEIYRIKLHFCFIERKDLASNIDMKYYIRKKMGTQTFKKI